MHLDTPICVTITSVLIVQEGTNELELSLAIIFLLPKADKMSLVYTAWIVPVLELFARVPRLY